MNDEFGDATEEDGHEHEQHKFAAVEFDRHHLMKHAFALHV